MASAQSYLGARRASKLSEKPRALVTCALPYANGEIHLGHVASTYLPADIFVRFLRLKGFEVVFVCATDDFGTPILIMAEQEGKNPGDFVAYWHGRDSEDFKGLGISFDIFYKTSSKENVELTQYFFRRLYKKELIYKRSILQPYCESCKKYLPDRYVRGTCPYCGATEQYSDSCERCGKTFQPWEVKDPHCALCGSTPASHESEHYFLKLSQFAASLEEWLRRNDNLQPEVKNYVLKWIEEGLKDWDITRDISWGVPIPLEEAGGKVLYGWFDNHIGYISTALKHFSDEGVDGRSFWNSATIYHFIGKDIVYHHYLFLPAMRLGVGEYDLPDFIPTRGHLLLHGQKFSKSRGWYVSLREFLRVFPADYLRYYLSTITPYTQTDVNFDWKEFQARINNELVANIGNFIHRTLSFIWSRFDQRVPDPDAYDESDRAFRDRIKAAPSDVGAELEKNHVDRALRKIIEFSSYCNQFFQRKEPWSDARNAKSCLFLCANAVRSLAILLEPYLPSSVQDLWNQLSLEGQIQQRSWTSASDLIVQGGHVIKRPRILFRKVEDEEIRKQIEKLPH